MKTTSSCVLNSTAILDAIRSRQSEILFEFHDVSKANEYLDLMRRIALPEYLATRGNRGAWCLHRTEADVTHFEMLTFWDDTDAIKRFAGDDFRMAK
jgi:hypothetical protein